MSKFFKSVSDEIRNDRGAKIAGITLMIASLAAVFVPGQSATFPRAAPFFLIGVYLAFRKTKRGDGKDD